MRQARPRSGADHDLTCRTRPAFAATVARREFCHRLSSAEKPGRRDGTVYSSWTARSFYMHYAQRLSCAAVMEDAKIINRGARFLWQRAARMQGVPA